MAKKGHKVSEKTRKKISDAKKGISWGTHSTKTKRKLSLAKMGSKNPNFGKKLSKETRKKMSIARKGGNTGSFKKGEHRSIATEFGIGQKPWNKGRKMTLVERKKNSIAQKKRYANGGEPWNKGKTGVYTEDTLEKIRNARSKQVFPLKDTNPEKYLQSLLRGKKIKFETHRNFVKKGINIYGQPDIFIEPNICIFVDGDYWHCNPNDYVYKKKLFPGFRPNDQITGKKYAKDKWARDKSVNDKLKKKDYIVIRFWQSELEEIPKKCLKKILKVIKK